MGKIQGISEASGLPLSEQLAILLCSSYEFVAQRHGKTTDSKELRETLSQWAPQEVAEKFLEFCKDNKGFFTKEDAWMLEVCPVLILAKLEAFGGVNAYLDFQNKGPS